MPTATTHGVLLPTVSIWNSDEEFEKAQWAGHFLCTCPTQLDQIDQFRG